MINLNMTQKEKETFLKSVPQMAPSEIVKSGSVPHFGSENDKDDENPMVTQNSLEI